MKSALIAIAALVIAGPAFAQTASTMPATADGVGVVQAIDQKTGTITLHHGPIPAMKWPAMTMTFKASTDVLKAAKTGEKVKFTLKPTGASGEVIAIQPN